MVTWEKLQELYNDEHVYPWRWGEKGALKNEKCYHRC